MASSELIKWGKANAMSELSLIKAAEMFVEAEQYENAAKMLYILPNEIRYFDGTALPRDARTARFELVRDFFHQSWYGANQLPLSSTWIPGLAHFRYFYLFRTLDSTHLLPIY